MATGSSTRRVKSYLSVIREAVKELGKPGGSENVALVLMRLRKASEDSFKPMDDVRSDVTRHFHTLFNRVITKKRLMEKVPRYSRASLTREAQVELEKKILSSIELIRLNREVAVAKAMQRMAGWASSVPPTGADTSGEAQRIVKSLRQLPYEERRVVIDQGHKLVSSLENVVNCGAGAIAGIWHSHVHQAGYDYRVDHAKRDEKIYVIRGSWADKDGYVKAVDGYTDGQTMPAEEVNCRCYYQYLFNLKDLPASMLTEKGKAVLAGKIAHNAG